MPQTLFLVVGGGITEIADADIVRVLGMQGVRIATDEEVAEHLAVLGKHQASVAASKAVQASTPAEAASVPAQDATTATLDGTDKTTVVE